MSQGGQNKSWLSSAECHRADKTNHGYHQLCVKGRTKTNHGYHQLCVKGRTKTNHGYHQLCVTGQTKQIMAIISCVPRGGQNKSWLSSAECHRADKTNHGYHQLCVTGLRADKTNHGYHQLCATGQTKQIMAIISCVSRGRQNKSWLSSAVCHRAEGRQNKSWL